jgi:hypothetical protein
VLQVLAAVGTGIGVLGFVAAFGGAVLYIRADAAQLPATEAVAVIPREALVATGAALLVPALLLAVLSVLVLFVADVVVQMIDRKALKAAHNRAAEAREWARQSELEVAGTQELARGHRRSAEVANQAVSQGLTEGPIPDWVEGARRQAEESMKAASEAEAKAGALDAAAAVAAQKAEQAMQSAEWLSARQKVVKRVVIAGVLVSIQLLSLLLIGSGLTFGQILVLAGVAGLTTFVSLAVYRETDRFIWFTVAAFLSIGIFVGVTDYDRIRNEPKVEPAAVLRTDGTAATGFFIAQTDKRIYLARPSEQRPGPRIIEISRGDVRELAIGTLVNPTLALERAPALAEALCLADAKKPKGETESACAIH